MGMVIRAVRMAVAEERMNREPAVLGAPGKNGNYGVRENLAIFLVGLCHPFATTQPSCGSMSAAGGALPFH